MARFIASVFLVGVATLGMSCSSSSSQAPNTLTGDTNVPAAQVGNQITMPSIKVGQDYLNSDAQMTVVSNDNGLVTANVTADLTKDPRLAKYAALIPASAKDSTGKINTQVKFRVTTEGVQDFFNKDQVAHTVVKYNAVVGDTYKITKSDGVTITRTVVARSDQDDFGYGLLNIKTITLEQDSRIPGIKKFIYRANHKFGIVYVEVVADDGSSMNTYLYSKN
jgi:hypothetical protein